MRTTRLLRSMASESRLRVGMPVSAFAFAASATATPSQSILERYPSGVGGLDPEDLSKLVASPAFDVNHPTSTGRITNQISDNVFVVNFDPAASSGEGNLRRDIEVGTRVTWSKPAPTEGADAPPTNTTTATPAPPAAPASPKEVKATVTKLHGNGLVAIIEDDTADFHNAVPRDQLKLLRSSANLDSNDALAHMMQWLQKSGGVTKTIDAYSAACVLYRKGWRLQDLHLVEAADIHVLKFLPRSARMTIIEAAERERDVARIQREMRKETLMEQDWSYWLSKYSKVWGPIAGSVSVLSAFLWNYKNYQRGMRPAQISIAAANWNHVPQNTTHVSRPQEEEILVNYIQDLGPRQQSVVVVTGNIGVGKTLLINGVTTSIGAPTLAVELRGAAKDDPLTAIVKALGVPNINVCGELREFLKDVAQELTKKTGKIPIVVLKIRDDDVEKIHREALLMSKHVRVVLEVESEKAKHTLLKARQVKFFHVTDFSREQAKEFVGRRVDPVALEEFMDEIGTNATDLDALMTGTIDKKMDPFDVVAKRLQRAIADVRTQNKQVRRGLKELCKAPYEVGATAVSEAVAFSPLVQFHPVRKMYVFRTRAFYEAARIVANHDVTAVLPLQPPAVEVA